MKPRIQIAYSEPGEVPSVGSILTLRFSSVKENGTRTLHGVIPKNMTGSDAQWLGFCPATSPFYGHGNKMARPGQLYRVIVTNSMRESMKDRLARGAEKRYFDGIVLRERRERLSRDDPLEIINTKLRQAMFYLAAGKEVNEELLAELPLTAAQDLRVLASVGKGRDAHNLRLPKLIELVEDRKRDEGHVDLPKHLIAGKTGNVFTPRRFTDMW